MRSKVAQKIKIVKFSSPASRFEKYVLARKIHLNIEINTEKKNPLKCVYSSKLNQGVGDKKFTT